MDGSEPVKPVVCPAIPMLCAGQIQLVNQIDNGKNFREMFQTVKDMALSLDEATSMVSLHTIKDAFSNESDLEEMEVLLHTVPRKVLRSTAMQTLSYDFWERGTPKRKEWLYDAEGPGAYICSLYIEGRQGKSWTQKENRDLMRTLGSYARAVESWDKVNCSLGSDTAWGTSQFEDAHDVELAVTIDNMTRGENGQKDVEEAISTPLRFASSGENPAQHIRELISTLKLRGRPHGDPEDDCLQSFCMVGCSKEVVKRTQDHRLIGSMGNSAKLWALMVSCLRYNGLDPSETIIPICKAWKVRQINLAEILFTVIAGSLVSVGGMNVHPPGTRSETTAIPSDKSLNECKALVFKHNEWYLENVKDTVANDPLYARLQLLSPSAAESLFITSSPQFAPSHAPLIAEASLSQDADSDEDSREYEDDMLYEEGNEKEWEGFEGSDRRGNDDSGEDDEPTDGSRILSQMPNPPKAPRKGAAPRPEKTEAEKKQDEILLAHYEKLPPTMKNVATLLVANIGRCQKTAKIWNTSKQMPVTEKFCLDFIKEKKVFSDLWTQADEKRLQADWKQNPLRKQLESFNPKGNKNMVPMWKIFIHHLKVFPTDVVHSNLFLEPAKDITHGGKTFPDPNWSKTFCQTRAAGATPRLPVGTIPWINGGTDRFLDLFRVKMQDQDGSKSVAKIHDEVLAHFEAKGKTPTSQMSNLFRGIEKRLLRPQKQSRNNGEIPIFRLETEDLLVLKRAANGLKTTAAPSFFPLSSYWRIAMHGKTAKDWPKDKNSLNKLRSLLLLQHQRDEIVNDQQRGLSMSSLSEDPRPQKRRRLNP
ncbi:hypothetical protein F4778DRAFT_796227 [Xylariomycetidae sp. FL2044]|nr:hypothetical protein F4778DRAFT_796227 [Xylariomycetidae sp. FL2044]